MSHYPRVHRGWLEAWRSMQNNANGLVEDVEYGKANPGSLAALELGHAVSLSAPMHEAIEECREGVRRVLDDPDAMPPPASGDGPRRFIRGAVRRLEKAKATRSAALDICAGKHPCATHIAGMLKVLGVRPDAVTRGALDLHAACGGDFDAVDAAAGDAVREAQRGVDQAVARYGEGEVAAVTAAMVASRELARDMGYNPTYRPKPAPPDPSSPERRGPRRGRVTRDAEVKFYGGASRASIATIPEGTRVTYVEGGSGGWAVGKADAIRLLPGRSYDLQYYHLWAPDNAVEEDAANPEPVAP